MLKISRFQHHGKSMKLFLKSSISNRKLLIDKRGKSNFKTIVKRDITYRQAKEKLSQIFNNCRKNYSKSQFIAGVFGVVTITYGLHRFHNWFSTDKDKSKKEKVHNDTLTKEEEDAIESILSAIIESYTENALNQETEKTPALELLGNNRFKPVKNVTTTFSDIQGCDEAKQDLENLIHFLSNPEKFNEIGATLPRGVILVGAPGVGKTSLAKAVAGEAKVPFIYASASEFDEMYVGVGASRVRELFESAKAHAPCVIFIDELDAISNKKIDTSLRQSQSQTLSQLLIELDGFQSSKGIIVLSATNNKEALDKALIRPGRFDLEVEILPPDYEGRFALFKLYLSKVRNAENMDYEKLAKGSIGFTGADIKNMVNQAALIAVINNENIVQMDHLWKSRDRIIMGTARKKLPDNDTNRITAFHEAGHALAAFFTPDAEKIHKVTIIPRNHSLGYTSFLGDKEKYHLTKSHLLARIDSLLAGKIAEELIYGKEKVTSGGSDDLKRATAIAENMVLNLGMSDTLPFRTFSANPTGLQESNLSHNTKDMIDEEIDRILKESHERVHKLLFDNKEKLQLLAEALLKNETLDNLEVTELLSGKPVEPSEEKISDILGSYRSWVLDMSALKEEKTEKY